MTARYVSVAAVMIALTAGWLIAADAPPAPAPSTQPVLQEGPILADDLLRVSITDLNGPGIVTEILARVDGDGKISLPLVDQVNVKAMTLQEAANAVNKAYRVANLIPNLQSKLERVESGTNPSMRTGPIAADDYVRIEITDLVGPGIVTTKKVQVSKDGTAKLPLVGAVSIVKLTEAQAAKAVQKAYRQAKLIPNAAVTVRRIREVDAK